MPISASVAYEASKSIVNGLSIGSTPSNVIDRYGGIGASSVTSFSPQMPVACPPPLSTLSVNAGTLKECELSYVQIIVG